VAKLVVRVLENEDESNIHGFKREVRDICLRHPLYMTKAELALRRAKGNKGGIDMHTDEVTRLSKSMSEELGLYEGISINFLSLALRSSRRQERSPFI